MAKPSPCMRSVSQVAGQPSAEEFCDKLGFFQVVVTFNGHRYLVDLCEEHKAEHDDAAARKRMARKEANRKAREEHEDRRRSRLSA